jgi:16S rRNA (cytosine967-C5)-methyltransferase
LAIALARATDVSAARLAAFDVLKGVEEGGLSSILLAAREPELSSPDRSLCHELVMGVLRWRLLLDHLIQHYGNRDVDRLDRPVVISLRLGLYQLRFLSRIPSSAAVNESVKLVGHARVRSAQSFVNAVLRRATREPEYDPASKTNDPLERLAIHTSHPKWLINRWTTTLGIEGARELAIANNQIPPISFRVVHAKSAETRVLKELEQAGSAVTPSDLTPHAWRASMTSKLQEFVLNGQIYLQDEASQSVAQILEPRKNERILDLCAAPGGKTTQIAELIDNQGLVVACDRSASRLQTVASLISRQGMPSIQVARLDAEEPLPFFERAFDRVLVDAPCSGTGTLRHNPEIRWRITAEDIDRFSQRQLAILKNAAEAVRSGGRLLYSTCSLEQEENERVIEGFLEANDAYRLVPVTIAPSLQTATGLFRTWPHIQRTDGFFVAVMARRC